MPNLDFDGHNTLYATHGLHAYAAKCPPQLVKYGLRYYSKPGDTVLDPMVGSGTTLVEARLLGRNAIGYDIDPLARLIATVKSRSVSDRSIECAYDEVIHRSRADLIALRLDSASPVLRKRAELPDFPNRDYWFSPEVAESLAILSHHISEVSTTRAVRDFLWVAFSSLILGKTSVANARDIIHSRHHFWEHPQPPDVLEKFLARVSVMRKQMIDFRKRCQEAAPARVEVRIGDARRLRVQEETIDLIFTSPPYATALDYPRAHFLAVAWLQNALGISLADYFARTAAYIGTERGRQQKDFAADERLKDFAVASSVVSRLVKQSQRQAKLTQRYFVDMGRVLAEMARVLRENGHAILVVCPSHIRKIEVPTHRVFAEIGRSLGLKLVKQHTRTISERRRLLPYLRQAFGKRMDTEYVLVFQKL
jgi:DNA modification methylase